MRAMEIDTKGSAIPTTPALCPPPFQSDLDFNNLFSPSTEERRVVVDKKCDKTCSRRP